VKLRTRLLLAAGVILGVCVVGAVVLLRTQESFLVAQVDSELSSSRPFLRIPPPGFQDRAAPISAPEADNSPISNLFIGTIEDGELVTVLQG